MLPEGCGGFCPGDGTSYWATSWKSGNISFNHSPPSAGLILKWTDCCRKFGDNQLDVTGGDRSMTLRSVIRNVPYAVRAPCQPVMPEFLEEPVRQVCAGRPIELATIVRGTYGDDSLFVDWGKPVQEGPNGLQTDPFRLGYGFRKPFPDTTFNSSNVTAVMDSSTGIIRFTSHVIGDFTFALRVQRYRNGFWVSDNFREMLLRVVPNCDSLPGGATAYNDAPDLGVYHIGDTLVNPTVILEFVCVGDTVRLKFKAEDLDLDGNGVPQQLRLVAKGFAPDVDSGYYYMDCVNHNCAELTPVPNSSTSVSGQVYELSWVVPRCELRYVYE